MLRSAAKGRQELPIFDCRLLMDIRRRVTTPLFESPIGNENLVFGFGCAALFDLLSHGHVVEEDKLQNQMVAGELLRQGREGDRSADACKSRAVERVGA